MASVDQKDIKQGRVYLHPDSKGNTRIWAYENDLGEHHKDASKYSVMQIAEDDLRGALIDQYTEFTAVGKIRRFHFAPHFQRLEANRLMALLKQARKDARYWKDKYEEQKQNHDTFDDIQEDFFNILNAEMSDRQVFVRRILRNLKDRENHQQQQQ